MLCCLCRLRYRDVLAESRHRWPLAAALYSALLLPGPGFLDSRPAGRALVNVERVILGKLGVKSLEGRGDDETVVSVAKRAAGLFMFDSATGKYVFPRRRFCWLLGPKTSDVLELLGECAIGR